MGSTPPDAVTTGRLNRFKAELDDRYASIQKSAVRGLAHLEFRAGGLPALTQLAGEIKDPALQKEIQEILKKKSKSP